MEIENYRKETNYMSKRKNVQIAGVSASSTCPAWFESINGNTGSLRYFPHCKLGECLVPHVIGSESGCVMIYPVDGDTDIDEAAFILENAKEVPWRFHQKHRRIQIDIRGKPDPIHK